MNCSSHRLLTVVLIVLLTASCLFGIDSAAGDKEVDPDRGWTIGPTVGISWGRAHEIVNDTSGVVNQNDHVSLLLWDLMNVPTFGLDIRWDSGKKTVLKATVSSAIRGTPTGEMNDYDWLYTDRDWSHWSVSDVNLRWGLVLDLGGDWKVVNRGPFSLSLGAGYHLDWWAWTDITKDSIYSTTVGSYYPAPYGTYPADEFRDLPDYVDVGVNGIDYEVAYHTLLFTTVFRLDWDILFMKFSGGIGPVLAFSDDYHKRRYDWGPEGVHFYDTAVGFPWVNLNLIMGMHTQGRFSFYIGGTFDWLHEIRGNTIAQEPVSGATYKYIDAAGFSFWKVSLVLGGTWDLFGGS